MNTEPTATEQESEDLRALLRGALKPSAQSPDVLEGVQRKLRERSGGKFYHDRWSTDRHPPVLTYLVTSSLMLVTVVIVYLVLKPLRGEPLPQRPPEPVQVVPHKLGP